MIKENELKKELDNFTHTIKLPVRYSDLDTFGHVNNKAYLSYLEEARIDFHKRVFGWKGNGLQEFNAVVAKIEINYLKPVFYGETLLAYTRLSNIGTKSFEITTVFIVERPENKLAKVSESKVVLVTVDMKTGKATEITDKDREKLNTL
jgi:acyl-CoA thioester hydrolase